LLNTRAQNLLLLIEEEARRNAWGRVKEVLGVGAATLFLSCFAGVFSAIIPAVELCAGLELFGIDQSGHARACAAPAEIADYSVSQFVVAS
jgi:hypothetical protein